ncbi:MAG: DNA polymerase IV [Thermoplasmata archaeon]|nr:DNA polymerase IV [Thermoplasmata archaeon]
MVKKRFIIHVDMDAFFAAIEQRDNPAWRGQPVVVGADPKGGRGRGVVSAASYEARKFGIHSALPISIAYRKCPKAIFRPVDMAKYSQVSRQLHGILYNFTPEIEPVSIDEAFLDISGSYQLFGTPRQTCVLIKKRIKEEIDLIASVGLAPVKMVAKIASDFGKPDGLVEVTKEKLFDFLWPLEISKLWGVGVKTRQSLNEMGIWTVGQLAKKDVKALKKIFGANGEHLWSLANGIDERDVETETGAKSISNETTFGKDTADQDEIDSSLMWLCEKVSGRLRQAGLKGRTITLKIRVTGFQTYTRAITVPEPTNFVDVLYQQIQKLYKNFKVRKKVRLVGVKVSNFDLAGFQSDLFQQPTDQKREKIHRAVDAIKKKFGEESVHRGRVVK